MCLNRDDVLGFITSAGKFGTKLGLDNIAHLMARLGNPQNFLKFVHIAGTNGKGSTASFISSILIESGYKTGMYTSPHILNFNERMLINGREIDDNGIVKVGNEVINAVREMAEDGMECTEFEIVTAMAFLYFFEQRCDIVVLEVGLGGRLDCTNVISASLVSVITTIDYDHTKELGSSLKQIAYEKAGIIKENSAVISYQQKEEVCEVLAGCCKKKKASLQFADFENVGNIDFKISTCKDGRSYQTFSYRGYGEIKLRMLGEHQIYNAVVAICAVESLKNLSFNISVDAIKRGLYNAKWAGRFEVISKNPLIVVDGAHNPQGTKALSQNLKKYFRNRKILFVVGILADKDYDEMLEPVLKLGERFLTVTPFNSRAMGAGTLAKALRERGKAAISFSSVEEALTHGCNMVKDDEIICCFGSLYYVGRVRNAVEEQPI